MSRAQLTAAVVLTLGLCALLAPPVHAAQTAKISAAFNPERLGAATTVGFAFQIAPRGALPAPLTAMNIAYPKNLGFETSGLGVASCSPAALEAFGPSGCPPNSQMGYGRAVVEIPVAMDLIKERVTLSVFAGPSPDGFLHVLVAAIGKTPVEAEVILGGELLPGHLALTVPPIPSFPEAPYVAVATLQLTLGGHLTYYERIKGRSVPYHPPGVGLPDRCPRGGFAFAATFAFQDGSSSRAQTAIACPRRR